MLDTTACIDYLNGEKKIQKIFLELDDLFCITTISVYETCIGLERTRRKISEARYQMLYKKWNEFTNNLKVFSLNISESEEAAKIYDELNAKGDLIDDNDILIAGIMKKNGISKIITRNPVHFNKISNLEAIEY